MEVEVLQFLYILKGLGCSCNLFTIKTYGTGDQLTFPLIIFHI